MKMKSQLQYVLPWLLWKYCLFLKFKTYQLVRNDHWLDKRTFWIVVVSVRAAERWRCILATTATRWQCGGGRLLRSKAELDWECNSDEKSDCVSGGECGASLKVYPPRAVSAAVTAATLFFYYSSVFSAYVFA